jgi:predicted nucleotidyltransferase
MNNLVGSMMYYNLERLFYLLGHLLEKIAATLFGKTRQAVLTTLFERPQQPQYLREIARNTGVSPGSLQLELSQLVDADLVIRERDGNRVTYRPNTASQIYEELRSIIFKTCGIPVLIRNALQPLGDRLSQVSIYGSMAKGTSQSRSDVDLLVVGDIALAELVAALAPIEAAIGREINPRLYSNGEFKKKLAHRDRFLTAITQDPTIPVIGGQIDAR